MKWPALKDLRRAVARANIKLPDGPVIVMGHSGAFRTVMQWVDHRLVEQIILLDAMYAGESRVRRVHRRAASAPTSTS